ncbi:permease IIC component [Amedibacterium intestinale]|uniref:PTS sugar transporter subunit IIC n=1 Tax=Amedibacterium intestinale TaxID=2583452 RepID=UPI001373E18C|nr:PTS transporter subunit EIIC [Amedibacterium intestinale]BBK62631.1 permease IIC component [Amedibacterium intestinale]
MDGIFNSPVMIKLQEFGQKLGSNKFLSALQGAMMSCMAPIMVGAIFSIICAVGPMVGLFENGDAIYNILYAPYHFTMDLLSLWIVLIMGYQYGKAIGLKSPVMSAVQTTIVFTLIACTWGVNEAGASVIDVTYLGSSGMFIGFLCVFVVCQIEKFCIAHNIRVKMPDVCPPSLVNGFTAILPLAFALIPMYALQIIIQTATGGAFGICSGFMAILAAPLNALTSVSGMFVICGFAGLLWCFGIHGTMILMSVLMPLMMQALSANAAAYAQGGIEALTFYPVSLFGAMALCGGTGNTLPLAIFGLKAKSEQIRAVSKIALVPGWFGINEPMTFGMPIMYNPILCIPYVLAILVVMLCTLIGYQTGWLIPAFVPIMTLMPMGFAQFFGTLRWQNAIWDYLMLIPAGIVWYPFFKVYDNQLYKKEQETKAAENQA